MNVVPQQLPLQVAQLILGSEDAGRGRYLFACLSLIVCSAIAGFTLERGWFPHDEGQLGQAAERVLQGELPHRDFDEMYTGGLSFLNALSFYLWGINSFSMRLMLLVGLIGFSIAIFWLLRQLVAPWVAALLTVLACLWGIPIYPAAMPSWYNLFFATWTLCALVLFIQNGARRYLVVAGLLIGISIVIKISGIFVLAAALLFLLYRNQVQSVETEPACPALSTMISAALLFAGLVSLKFVDQNDTLLQSIHFALPFLALLGFVLHQEWNVARGSFGSRLAAIFGDVVPLLFGVLLPVAGFVAFYWQQDAIGALVQGTLIDPGKRLEFAWAPFPLFGTLAYALPVVLLLYGQPLLARYFDEPEQSDRLLLIATIGVCGWILLTEHTLPGFSRGFLSFRNLAPFMIIGNLQLLLRFRNDLDKRSRQSLFLFTAVPFFVTLIQYPYAAPIYFFYAAPLLLTTAVVAIRVQPWSPNRALLAFLVFLLVFSRLWFYGLLPGTDVQPHGHQLELVRLNTERSQIKVDAREARVYDRLQQLVSEHSQPGDTLLATPDAPEVCFLTNRRPLSRAMYEFFDEDFYANPESMRKQLTQSEVPLVVINELPEFSQQIPKEARTEILKDYRLLERIEMEFRSGKTGPRFSVYQRRSLPQ